MQTISPLSIIFIFALAAGILCVPNPSQAEQNPTELIQPGPKTISPALATTVSAAMFGHQEKKIFLIDVRPKAHFEQYRIAGALNIALHAIKTKPFLKAKPIVLVNNGYILSPLARTCQALNQAGFGATIMSGGLVAWKAKGGRLIGDPFAQQAMNKISPQTFLQESGYAHQVVIETFETQSAQGRRLHPPARHVALLKDKQGLREVKSIIRQMSSGPFFNLLIVAGTRKENDQIQRKLAQAGIHQAFFLQGGRQSLDRHHRYTALARRSKDERTVRTDGCSTCPQER